MPHYEAMDGLSFVCPQCKQRHTGLPALACGEPAAFLGEPGHERPVERFGDDFYVVEGQDFFVRVVLEIPIIGQNQNLEWGVWGSLSPANFQRYWDSFEDNDQSKLDSMFSYLSNEILGYPGSLGLPACLFHRDNRLRPLLLLDPDRDHPLVHDQKHGITAARAIELAMPVLHPQGGA
ncbi:MULTISPECIES: DUF2199 domain-containing protein [Rhodomicrobium]|uniref:DUF2199 domain-containing protein n=1 Tax=Rhodomicrobium TaxID=1068 RepID=UPI000B4B773F|nr:MULTISPECIES: DUF2199 domain-containing protein [Rhodomicrobium]